MNLADYLRKEFAYDAWANREVLAAIQASAGENTRSVALMAHILAAQRVWLERLRQVPQSVAVWPKPDLAQCQSEAEKLSREWHEYLELATAGDISQAISYKNSKGESWTSAIVDVLTQVVMHSAYHRGQIAAYMRSIGLTPAYTDFIHGVRQGLVK